MKSIITSAVTGVLAQMAEGGGDIQCRYATSSREGEKRPSPGLSHQLQQVHQKASDAAVNCSRESGQGFMIPPAACTAGSVARSHRVTLAAGRWGGGLRAGFAHVQLRAVW